MEEILELLSHYNAPETLLDGLTDEQFELLKPPLLRAMVEYVVEEYLIFELKEGSSYDERGDPIVTE